MMNPNISILIVDDDMNKIQNIIATIKDKIKDVPLKIDQAINVTESKEYLNKNKYHLLISDLQMPLYENGELLQNGGEILIKEIYKKRNKLNVPLYIIGLTQHKEFISNFNNLWKVLFYSMSEEGWKIYLRDLIFHIELIKSNLVQHLIETIYVEGINDFKLLQKTTELYFPNQLTKFKIDYLEYGGGINWVERRILIWSKSLNKKDDQTPLKAIGLFDNVPPGLKSINNLEQNIAQESAERKTFSIIATYPKYSSTLKSIKSKGIDFYTTMEDLIGIDVWKSAKENNWLELRKKENYVGIENIDKTMLASKGLTEEEILQTLYKVSDKYKNNFTNLALKNKNDLINISYLLKDCIEKLKI